MNTNFSKYCYILYIFFLPFIAQAQKEQHYLIFEEKEGKINEKPIEEVFFDEKGNFIKAFAFREKDTIPIGQSYDCLSKECITAQHKGEKIKEKKNTISVTEIDDFHYTKTEITYFFDNEKLIKKITNETPFSPNQTLYFYDNRQRVTLIVENLGINNVIYSTQFEYESKFSKNISIEKRTSFDDGEISERKLIYIEQNEN